MVMTADQVQAAMENEEAIISLKRGIQAGFIDLGRRLKDHRDRGWYHASGYETFEEFLASPEVDVSRAFAFRLIQIVETLLPIVAPVRLADIGVAKLQDILPLVETNHLHPLLEKAETLTRRDLRREIKALRRAEDVAKLKEDLEARAAIEAAVVDDELIPVIDSAVYPADPRADRRFKGSTSPTVVEQCLLRYTMPGWLVLDSMAGSGTAGDVCRRMGRRCLMFDVTPLRPDVALGDARSVEVAVGTVDFIFNHFPSADRVCYSELHGGQHPELDLSLLPPDRFLEESGKVFGHNWRLLKRDRFYAVLVGDLRRDRQLVDLAAGLSVLGREAGFQLYDKAIVGRKIEGENAGLRHWQAEEYNVHVSDFEILLIFRKG